MKIQFHSKGKNGKILKNMLCKLGSNNSNSSSNIIKQWICQVEEYQLCLEERVYK